MKRQVGLWQFAGFSLSTLAGTLLHFLYDWTGENRLIAIISGVNESTWEHMKLLFFPLALFALVQSCFFKDHTFWWIKLVGIVTGLAAIPVLFYTYNGAFGKSPDWLNITFFFAAAAIAFFVEYVLFKLRLPLLASPWISVALLCVIGVAFALFTFFTPTIPLFCDPLTGTYGIA